MKHRSPDTAPRIAGYVRGWIWAGAIAGMLVPPVVWVATSAAPVAHASPSTATPTARATFTPRELPPLRVASDVPMSQSLSHGEAEIPNPTVVTSDGAPPETALSAPWTPEPPVAGLPDSPQPPSVAPEATQPVAPSPTPTVAPTTVPATTTATTPAATTPPTTTAPPVTEPTVTTPEEPPVTVPIETETTTEVVE